MANRASGRTEPIDNRFTTEFYDHVAAYRERQDVAFFVEMAVTAVGDLRVADPQVAASGGSILEIGCGTGRILIPTARVITSRRPQIADSQIADPQIAISTAGREIVGLDLSPWMLAVCRDNLAAEPAEVQACVQLVEGDMRDFDLGREFACITIPFRLFQQLTTVEDQMACLATIRRHLAPGGRLVIDLANPSTHHLTAPKRLRDYLGAIHRRLATGSRLVLDLFNESPFAPSVSRLAARARLEEFGDEPEFTMPDGRRVRQRSRTASWDTFNQVQDVELIFYVTHPDGRQERLVHAFSSRHLYRFEAEHLLARCGFEVEALYADYDKSPYGSKQPGELIFVARKSASSTVD